MDSHLALFDFVDVLLEYPFPLPLVGRKRIYAFRLCQELFKSAVNGKNGQDRQPSCDVPLLYMRTSKLWSIKESCVSIPRPAQSWDCSLAWCCSKMHSTKCSSFGSSLGQSIDRFHSTKNRRPVVAVVLLLSVVHQAVSGGSSLRGNCVA